MTIDFDKLVPYPTPEYVSAEPAYDLVYPIPSTDAFKTVSGAVFYVLSRCAPGETVPRDEVPGGIVYNLKLNDTPFQLFILHVSDRVACLRLHYLHPASELVLNGLDVVWRPRDPKSPYRRGIAALFGAIHEAIVDLLRYSIEVGKETIPPVPPATDMHAVFRWQEIYHPTMTDRELADKVGISHQGLRNARSKSQLTKREARKHSLNSQVARGKRKS
jgi:hypothetical protein